MKTLITTLIITLISLQSFAESLYDRKVKDVRLYDMFVKQGVPEAAVQRTFEFLDVNSGKTIKVRSKVRGKEKTFMDDREVTIRSELIAVIDFSKPSNERRLYVMNLKDGSVAKHFVAHGKGSGVRVAAKFSNIDGSKMSSLGLFLGGNTYFGGHGESLNLYGLEASNSNAAERDIVVHAANYVSEDYVKSQGRLGRSWGCPAVAPGIIRKMLNGFKDGGLIYAYHKDLISSAAKDPTLQEVQAGSEKDDEDVDLPDEEESVRKGQSAVSVTADSAAAAK
ncbi:murein L,D-transpeptidase catalytic domain family protein [Bdellovibrio bacteriovorus]|uniref:murein L,D-transpeptidase catalytic domain family protein n=1 Tax=Bdellovibrio bacteriovorus TaxID=959 RepID=UPI0021D01AB6|nr:murein L,D-transpeptidase catalytic domain family protein [Bdellovibrio bacteriovorus]UXR64631.1 murein L,D-transpeptidase catalytic domain family protein [Bdellovibrio bacteriovorus]